MSEHDPQYHTWCPIEPSRCAPLPTAEAALAHVLTHDPHIVAKCLLRERYIRLLITDDLAGIEHRAAARADTFVPDPLADGEPVYEIRFESLELPLVTK